MRCELCHRQSAESVGIYCGEHKICMPCISKLIKDALLSLS